MLLSNNQYQGCREQSAFFEGFKNCSLGSSCCGIAETNPTRNHEVSRSIPGLAQWVKGSGIAVSCGVGRRFGLDLAVLWLWCRPAAVAPIQPLAWELTCVTGMALKKAKTKTKNQKKPSMHMMPPLI